MILSRQFHLAAPARDTPNRDCSAQVSRKEHDFVLSDSVSDDFVLSDFVFNDPVPDDFVFNDFVFPCFVVSGSGLTGRLFSGALWLVAQKNSNLHPL